MGKVLKSLPFWVILTFFITSLMSCDETECTDSTTVILRGGLYNSDLTKYSPDTVSLYAKRPFKDDSLLIDTSLIINPLELPLRISGDTSTYIINFINRLEDENRSDTIHFVHQNKEHFISEACGCVMYHIMDTVIYTRNKIRSISIANKDVTNEEQENIQIYF